MFILKSQDSTKDAYVNRKGEVKCNLQEIEVPTVEQSVRKGALEVQDIRELGLGRAWFVNDLRAFLPAWQEMELASPSPEEPVTQIEADVPIEPLALHADAMDLELDLHSYERPLAVSPFGTPELAPDWQETHAMSLSLRKCPELGKWIRTGLGVRAYQGLGKNSPSREQVVRRITRDLHTYRLIEYCTVVAFLAVVIPLLLRGTLRLASCIAFNHGCLAHPSHHPCRFLHFFLRGGGGPPPFQKLTPQGVACWVRRHCCQCDNSLKMLKRSVQLMIPNSKCRICETPSRKR